MTQHLVTVIGWHVNVNENQDGSKWEAWKSSAVVCTCGIDLWGEIDTKTHLREANQEKKVEDR